MEKQNSLQNNDAIKETGEAKEAKEAKEGKKLKVRAVKVRQRARADQRGKPLEREGTRGLVRAIKTPGRGVSVSMVAAQGGGTLKRGIPLIKVKKAPHVKVSRPPLARRPGWERAGVLEYGNRSRNVGQVRRIRVKFNKKKR